jgi:hypothetical protein
VSPLFPIHSATSHDEIFFLKHITSCAISSSHGGEYEAQNILGCTAVFLIELIQLGTWQYIPEDSELHNILFHNGTSCIAVFH